MNNEGSTITTGLSGDALKFGKGYNAFIWPTVLWISAVALVIPLKLLILSNLTTEEETTPAPKPTKIKEEVKGRIRSAFIMNTMRIIDIEKPL